MQCDIQRGCDHSHYLHHHHHLPRGEEDTSGDGDKGEDVGHVTLGRAQQLVRPGHETALKKSAQAIPLG